MVAGWVRAQDGAPLGGVAVSDGSVVSLTAADGSFRIDRPAGGLVWVALPGGWWTDAWYAPAAGEVTFTLAPTKQPMPVAIGQVTDLHLSAVPEPVRLTHPDAMMGWDAEGRLGTRNLSSPADVWAAVADLGPLDLVVVTGDLTDHGTPAEYALAHQTLSGMGCRARGLPGNHDHYGHRHAADGRDEGAVREAGSMGSMSTWRWEAHLGPRWWSLTWGLGTAALHLVALDWFAWREGRDREMQERWLAADLARLPAGAAVLVLSHDQLPGSFFAGLPAHVRCVGCLSGHWHTSRVVRRDGVWHVNTGNASFGAYDWAPAHSRVIGWDGAELSLRTVARGGSAALSGATSRAATGPVRPLGGDRWRTRLPGAAHLGRPVLCPGEVALVPWLDDDRATGGVSAIDVANGDPRWVLDVGAPIKGGVAVAGDAVVVAGVDGRVVCADRDSGAARWRATVGEDPLLNWVYATPTVVADAVVVGEYRNVACLDLASGAERWRIGWFDPFENTISPSGGVLADGVLVLGLAMALPHTVGVDPETGEVIWSAPGPEHRCPLTEFVVDPDDGGVIVGRLGGRLDKCRPDTGELVWKTRLGALFLAGRPLLAGDLLVVTTGVGDVIRVDPRTGELRWSTHLEGDALLAFGPYRRSGQAVTAGAALGEDGYVWVGATDGWVWRIDPATGAARRWIGVGAPLTAPLLALAGGDLLVAAADGALRRVATEPAPT